MLNTCAAIRPDRRMSHVHQPIGFSNLLLVDDFVITRCHVTRIDRNMERRPDGNREYVFIAFFIFLLFL